MLLNQIAYLNKCLISSITNTDPHCFSLLPVMKLQSVNYKVLRCRKFEFLKYQTLDIIIQEYYHPSIKVPRHTLVKKENRPVKKQGQTLEMSRAFCQNDVWVFSPPKWRDEWENTEWQRNRRWSETERRVNHPGCHLFLWSPVILKLFSLISDYRRQSRFLSKAQPQTFWGYRKNVYAVWNSEAFSFLVFGRQSNLIPHMYSLHIIFMTAE